MGQRNIALTERSRDKLLHIEAPGCVINIRVGLHDDLGRPVVAVSVAADGSRYAGDPEWWINGESGNGGASVRVVCTGHKAEA